MRHEPVTLLTVDPGLMTGWAISTLWPDASAPEAGNVHAHPLLGRYDFQLHAQGTVTWLQSLTDAPGIVATAAIHAINARTPLMTVIEQFVINKTALQKNTTWSSEVLGVFALASKQFSADIALDLTQKPSQIKTLFIANKVLEQAGIKQPRKAMVSHEQDAIAHGMLYGTRLHNGETRVGLQRLGDMRTDQIQPSTTPPERP